MSEGARKGFWSTIPGFVTGAAGLLTALVGLLTASAQLGWIGGDAKDDGATETSTSVPGEAGDGSTGGVMGGGAGGTGSAAVAKLELDPDSVSFPAVGTAERTVTVSNAGTSTVSVGAEVVDDDAERFTADAADCTRARLEPRDTCEITLRYDGGGVVGGSRATLEVRAGGTVAATADLRGGLL